MASKITFKPKQVTKRLLSVLPDRACDIVEKRFGLKDGKKQTLESIGKEYGITRERVRQIENFALQNIRKSDVFEEEQAVFSELEQLLLSMGGVVAEDEFLSEISKDQTIQNHFHFYLELGAPFKKQKEDAHFKHRWTVDPETALKVEKALKDLYASLKKEDLVPEDELLNHFLQSASNIAKDYVNEQNARRWLTLSKRISKNPLGEWGVADSPNIHARGVRDYAFLVIRRHGNPMHFAEVAQAIEEAFGKKAHVATTHNELIKDPRFVLVGRGLYGLAEWGYASGVVRDVIREVLKKYGSLSKKDIIEKVLTERYVKPNTVMVNLQNGKYFKKNKDGTYSLV